MALQVWLPLNGNLNNKGLASDLVFTNVNTSNTTIDNNGKIGTCYKNNSFTAGGLISNTTIDLGSKQSMFCWFKFDSLTSSSSLGGAMVGQHRSTNNTGMGLTIKYVSSTTGYLSINTGNGSSRTYNTYCCTTLLSAGNWYHGGFTYDGTTIKIYLNGVCEKTVTFSGMAVPADYVIVFNWSLSGSSGTSLIGNYRLNGSLNDVRVYNHCLSPKEVYEISKGLILHYPLNDPYIEPTTNLITTSDCLFSTCFNGATSTYGYGTTTDIYKTTGIFNDRFGTKVYMGTSGNSAYPYVYVANLYVSDGSNSPAYKTLSFDFFTNNPNTTYIVPYKLGSGTSTCTWFNNTTTTKTGSGTNSANIPVLPNMWNHITMVLRGTTNADAQWGYIRLGSAAHTSNTNYYWVFANMQLETKTYETGYAGVGGTRASNQIVYDSSGYEYNSTINGYCELKNSEARYQNGISFDGTSTYIMTPINGYNTLYTFALWAKFEHFSVHLLDCRTSSGVGYQPMYITSSSIQIGGSGTSYPTITYTFSTYKWYHIAVVYASDRGIVYINGEKIGESTSTRGYNYGTDLPLYIGCRYNNTNWFNGHISDFRLYATALSEQDIKDLYKISAYIDNYGNTFGYEFVDENTNFEIFKTGVLKTNNFIESNEYIYLPAGTYINTELYYNNGDKCRAETVIRYESDGTGRDLMGFSGSSAGYWGVTSAGAWEPHGTFTYTNSDITLKNTITFEYTASTTNTNDKGNYIVGALGSTWTNRNKFIYSVRLYKNDILERDLYPIKINNKVGLINILTNQYYLANNTNGILNNNDSIIVASVFDNKLESNQIIEI